MKLFSVSVGLLLAALGVFFVPVSFSVDGFGLVVNPGGVRTIRSLKPGQVLHFSSDDGRFYPGQIVTAVTYGDAVAQNALLEGTLMRELAKAETDHLEKASKLLVDLDRDRAKRDATADRLAARKALMLETAALLADLQTYSRSSQSDIDALNEERLAQLAKLEDLVKRSGEVSALPAQRLATMLEDIQAERLSVITSKGTRFSTEKTIIDLVKAINDLNYNNSIDEAEITILTERLDNLAEQLRELEALRDTMRAEAEARYLAKAVLPQVALADGVSVDMRTLQASRADVARDDPLRLLATRDPATGLSILVYGHATEGAVTLRHGTQTIDIALPVDGDQLSRALRDSGLDVAAIHTDHERAGPFDLFSIFAEFAAPPTDRLSVVSARAHDDRGLPVMVNTDISLPDPDAPAAKPGQSQEIVGFLENRHAVVLSPGQPVRGTISDTRTGSEIVFDARLLDRDYATVDTRELGIRLGNQSLAAKIIKRGVLSQVVVGVDENSAQQIGHLPGAVVHLSFPLARQSLFKFLMARNDTL